MPNLQCAKVRAAAVRDRGGFLEPPRDARPHAYWLWLNGKPLGVLWTAPFRADRTDAPRDGVNDLIVEGTNTWYNRLVSDATLSADQRITRTNVPTSGGQPWAKLEPIDSGLLGPVRLITRQQVLIQ